MALKYLGNGNWKSLSTDAKPSGVPTDTRLRYTDTNAEYYFDGTYWRIVRNPGSLPSSGRKTGWWTGLNSGDALLDSGGTPSITSAGTPITAVFDATAGRGARYDTSATAGVYAGCRNTFAVAMRAWNPVFRAKFRVTNPNADASQRFFCGITSVATALANSNDQLNAIHGVGIAIRSTDTVWQIATNDGANATVFTPVTGNPGVDATIRTIEIYGDEANTRFGVIFDGGAAQHFTVDIPTQTAALIPQACNYNVIAASRPFDLFWAEMESDK
jgi:hypothetical protein